MQTAGHCGGHTDKKEDPPMQTAGHCDGHTD